MKESVLNMKNYLKEIILLLIQLFMFYVFPLFAGPTDAMGMVLLIILMTFWLSIFMGCFSNKKIKYLYPMIITLLFLPSVFLYYNKSAYVHSLWYFIISYLGIFFGILINKFFMILVKNKT